MNARRLSACLCSCGAAGLTLLEFDLEPWEAEQNQRWEADLLRPYCAIFAVGHLRPRVRPFSPKARWVCGPCLDIATVQKVMGW